MELEQLVASRGRFCAILRKQNCRCDVCRVEYYRSFTSVVLRHHLQYIICHYQQVVIIESF